MSYFIFGLGVKNGAFRNFNLSSAINKSPCCSILLCQSARKRALTIRKIAGQMFSLPRYLAHSRRFICVRAFYFDMKRLSLIMD